MTVMPSRSPHRPMENLDDIVTANLRPATPPKAADFAGGLAVVAAGLFIGLLLRDRIGAPDIALMLLIAVQVVAIVYGLWPALAASVASTLGYNFLFIPPLYTFSVADPANVLTLFFFAVAALITSGLTSLVRSHALMAKKAHVEVETEKLRSALLTSVSHDLRTPLASILGSATTLKTCRETLDDGAQRQLIETIREETERLNRFISELLDMTKLESGAVAPRMEFVDLSDVVGSALHRAGDVLKHHTLTTALSPDLPMVKLDPVLFEQVLFNLLDNVAKYAPAGTAIALSAERTGPSITLTLSDEGEGIPPADLDRIFQKFYRVHAADRQRAGTGLGLAISRGFIEAMGGRIFAQNRRDRRGAVFAIQIPVPEPSPEPEHAA